MKNFKKEFPIVLLVLIPFILVALLWNKLPDELPSHWNMNGKVDGTMSKGFYPVFSLGLYLLLLFIPRIDPKKRNYDAFSGPYYKLRIVLALFFTFIPCVVFINAAGTELPLNKLILGAVYVLFVLMGNYMNNLKMNWFVGIRLPWTLSNEEVWRKTHRFGSRLFMLAGLIGLIQLSLMEADISFTGALILIGLAVIGPVVYSYALYMKLDKKAD